MTFAACAGPAPRSLKASSTDCSATWSSWICPNGPTRALDNLGKIYAMTRVIIDLLERESASERDLRGILKDVGELSHIAEKELHAVMLACKRARQQTLSTIAVGKPTVH